MGAADTHFTTPHGLDAADHYSTASDLALIGADLLEDPVLAEIVATRERDDRGLASERSQLENTNLLLETYPGAIGIKTGFTAGAGNVLVSAAEKKGRRLIAVAMGSADSFEDSRLLLDYGFAVLRRGIVLRAGTPVGGVVFDALGASGIVAGRDRPRVTDPAEVRLRFDAADDLQATDSRTARRLGRSRSTTAPGTMATVDAVSTTAIDA